MFIAKFPRTSLGRMGGWVCLPSVRCGPGTLVLPLAHTCTWGEWGGWPDCWTLWVEWVVCQTLRRAFGCYEYLGIVMGVFAVFFFGISTALMNVKPNTVAMELGPGGIRKGGIYWDEVLRGVSSVDGFFFLFAFQTPH